MSDGKQLSWAELAQMSSGEIKAPPILPVGHYSAIITGAGETGNSSKKGTPFVTYPTRLTGALGDVDAEQLAEIDDPFSKTRDLTFYLTANSLFMLTDLARALGAPVDSQTITETIEWLGISGEPLVVLGYHEANERNPDRPFFKIGEAAALSEYEARQQQG